tara:strand:- start:162 stop:599 length:438 start_codon:yes stop_codon:yes gene_type:complete
VINEYTDWKVVFFVIAGSAFLIGVTAIFIIPKEPTRAERSADGPQASNVDWIGAFLFTAGALLLLISLSQGASMGWKAPLVIAFLILSVLFLASFGFWEHFLEVRDREPLMRISTFKNGRFTIAMLIVCIFSAGFTNFLVYSTYL